MSYDPKNPGTEAKNGNTDGNRANATKKVKQNADDKVRFENKHS